MMSPGRGVRSALTTAACLVVVSTACLMRAMAFSPPSKAPARVPFHPPEGAHHPVVAGSQHAQQHQHGPSAGISPARASKCPFLQANSGGRIRLLLTELASSSVHPDTERDGGAAVAVAVAGDDPASQILPAMAAAVRDYFRSLDDLYARSSSIKCPFWRRRAADAVDSLALIARFLLIRHKSLGFLDPLWDLEDGSVDSLVRSDALQPPGCKPLGYFRRTTGKSQSKTATATTGVKHRHLPLDEVARSIRHDWVSSPSGRADKGYYITGRLNSTLYVNSCLFDGPDPDMPVRGLRKYLSAASHLFDSGQSSAELLDLTYEEGGGKMGMGSVEATWRLSGTLMLPWRPRVRPWTGSTVYHLDEEGLVYRHEERWDISVWEAFVCTVWPEVGERIWGKSGEDVEAVTEAGTR